MYIYSIYILYILCLCGIVLQQQTFILQKEQCRSTFSETVALIANNNQSSVTLLTRSLEVNTLIPLGSLTHLCTVTPRKDGVLQNIKHEDTIMVCWTCLSLQKHRGPQTIFQQTDRNPIISGTRLRQMKSSAATGGRPSLHK